MSITAEQVRELRERTGAGLMECKKALAAVGGDIDAAIDAMRKAGQTKADKKAGRVTAEGMVVIDIASDSKSAIMLEVNCETDFVGRDENFKQFTTLLASKALAAKIADVSKLGSIALNNGAGATIEEARQTLIAKIGENIQIRRAVLLETSSNTIASYVHGGRIGVLVEFKNGNAELGKDLAMHIAANNPQVVAPSDVSAELIAKEKEIFMAQAQSSGKPQAIIEKMVEGRIKKFLDEISLLGQPFVKNPDLTIAQLLNQSNAQVISFVRFALGEGIEKNTENFAEAVMAQVRGA
jgi:elongation factor Ts